MRALGLKVDFFTKLFQKTLKLKALIYQKKRLVTVSLLVESSLEPFFSAVSQTLHLVMWTAGKISN